MEILNYCSNAIEWGMNGAGRLAFSPWLSQSDWDKVKATKPDNFEFIRFNDITVLDVTTPNGYKTCFARLNRVTREAMWIDPGCICSMKCFLMNLVGFHEITGAVRVVYHAASGIFGALKSIAPGLYHTVLDVADLELGRAFHTGFIEETLVRSTKTLTFEFYEVARVIYYTIGMQLAALVGMTFSGFKGREILNLMESNYNYNVPIKRRARGPRDPFYSMACMQPWAVNIDAPVVLGGRRQPRYYIHAASQNILEIDPNDRHPTLSHRHWACLPLVPFVC